MEERGGDGITNYCTFSHECTEFPAVLSVKFCHSGRKTILGSEDVGVKSLFWMCWLLDTFERCVLKP
jgi:hypothetical protein